MGLRTFSQECQQDQSQQKQECLRGKAGFRDD